MNSDITKALQCASQVLAGQSPDITAAQLENALLAMGDLRKRLANRDPDVELLSKALDIVRAAEQHRGSNERRTVKARLHASATDQLDAHVAIHKRDGESTPQTYARLAREAEPGFVSIYEHLRDVQREL